MTPPTGSTRAAAAALIALLVLLPGCITFYGDAQLDVRVVVTQDMGTRVLQDENVTLPEGATAMDAIREIATVETAYGGGFVTAIDGRESRHPDADVDWFYHVDTHLADTGAASYTLTDGDLVLWDHRPWNRTMTLPHVLTGLDTWPGTLPDEPALTPEAWHENTTTEHRAKHLFAREDGDTLVLLDEHGTPADRLDPPWLVVHAADGPDSTPGLLVHASSPDALDLAERLDEVRPRGLGVALTPDATLEVPR